MLAQYNGNCRYCGLITYGGLDVYDPITKTSYHQECWTRDPDRIPNQIPRSLVKKRNRVDYFTARRQSEDNDEARWWEDR